MAITECALNTSFPLDCKNSKGGVKKIGFAVFTDALAIGGGSAPTYASGVITAWSGANGKFYDYAARPGQITVENTRTTSEANGTSFSSQTCTTKLEKLSGATSQELIKLEGVRTFVAWKDRNNKCWVLGICNGININEVKETPGTAMGDFNGYTISGKGEEEIPMLEISSGIFAGLFT